MKKINAVYYINEFAFENKEKNIRLKKHKIRIEFRNFIQTSDINYYSIFAQNFVVKLKYNSLNHKPKVIIWCKFWSSLQFVSLMYFVEFLVDDFTIFEFQRINFWIVELNFRNNVDEYSFRFRHFNNFINIFSDIKVIINHNRWFNVCFFVVINDNFINYNRFYIRIKININDICFRVKKFIKIFEIDDDEFYREFGF